MVTISDLIGDIRAGVLGAQASVWEDIKKKNRKLKSEENSDTELERFEYVETLVRIAIEKFRNKRKPAENQPCHVRIRTLLERHVVPNALAIIAQADGIDEFEVAMEAEEDELEEAHDMRQHPSQTSWRVWVFRWGSQTETNTEEQEVQCAEDVAALCVRPPDVVYCA